MGSETTITGCILARNEERKIEEALKSLVGWVDEIIVIDNESSDSTVEIALKYTTHILKSNKSMNFDAYRNLAIEAASSEWIFYLDADERVPEELGKQIRAKVLNDGDKFEAMLIPFKHYFCGKWIQHCGWSPGYTRPQLLKKGHFKYNNRLHSGIEVKGRTIFFRSDDPDIAIIHYSYDNLSHYLTKLNSYTDGEAQNLYEDNEVCDWRAMLAHFMHDWQVYYEQGEAYKDGMHGFILSFMSAFYRFSSRAKLWDLKREHNELIDDATLPHSIREMLEFMALVCQEGSNKWLTSKINDQIVTIPSYPIIWRSPIMDSSGYADSSRNLLFSFMDAGNEIKIVEEKWNEIQTELPNEELERIQQNLITHDYFSDLEIHYSLPVLQIPSVKTNFRIARTMFETEMLPKEFVNNLNQLDRIWVPTEFNRNGFVNSGIDPQKIAIIPEAIDSKRFSKRTKSIKLLSNEKYKFLSIFDWTLHKGWDILLEAFVYEFGSNEEVGLYIKTWSSNGYSIEQIHDQSDSHLKNCFGHGLDHYKNIHIWQEHLTSKQLPELYHSVDCFIIPTRCDGWCRPLMEAMASGLPTIATNWSGPAQYHNEKYGYPLRYNLQLVSSLGSREIPCYKGQIWAEPDVNHLISLMKNVYLNQDEAKKKGNLAKIYIAKNYDRSIVANLINEEIEYCKRMNLARKLSENHVELDNHPGSSVVLLQCASSEQGSLLQISQTVHREYSIKQNIDYVAKLGTQQHGRTNDWDKIYLIRSALNNSKYEFIVYMNSEALIVNSNVLLSSALPRDKWLGMVGIGNPGTYHFGVLYIRNCIQSKVFFEEVWNTFPVDAPNEVDTAMTRVLSFNSDRWQGVCIVNDAWNSVFQLNECSTPYVVSWLGYGSILDRTNLMQNAVNSLSQFNQGAKHNHSGQNTSVAVNENRQMILTPPSTLPVDTPPEVNFKSILGRNLRIQWEGDFKVVSSLAHVNREICIRLLQRPDIEISSTTISQYSNMLEGADKIKYESLFEQLQQPLSGVPDVVIRHHWPPNWNEPSSGKLIIIQPWELSHLLSAEWITGASQNATEVWAYSRFVRDIYVRSSVPAEKVRIVPLGVDTDTFTPSGAVYDLPHHKITGEIPFRILYVGGTVDRKGADILLQAYLKAFKVTDNVSLVVKDMGSHTFYKNQNFGDVFQILSNDTSAPQIDYISADMSLIDLASLYRSCQCLVLPYRGEGFGLSPLEGMSCGLMPITTSGGSTDDYLDDNTSIRLPYSKRFRYMSMLDNSSKQVKVWDLDPDINSLIHALQWSFHHTNECKVKGNLGRKYIEQNWTWNQTISQICNRLEKILKWPAQLTTNAEISVHSNSTNIKIPSFKPKDGISLCMIVRNEANCLADCLTSISPYVDEMIVVDTGSTDDTKEIAANCGAKIYDFEWTDSFAEARNYSLLKAKYKWIFWMDADDIINEECGSRLRRTVEQYADKNVAFQVQVKIPAPDKQYNDTVVDHIKLFPNIPSLRFEHRIHEQILPSLRRANIAVINSEIYVTHANYDRSVIGQSKKRLRDFHLLEQDLRDHPEHPFVLFNLAMTYLYATREYEVAAHYILRCLKVSHWQDSIVRKAYAILTSARICQQEWDLAMAANEEGRKYYPHDAELLFQAGQIYQQTNQYDQARNCLEELISSSDDPHYKSVDISLRSYRGKHELALLFRKMGDLSHCIYMLYDIITEFTNYLPARYDLISTLRAAGRNEEADMLVISDV